MGAFAAFDLLVSGQVVAPAGFTHALSYRALRPAGSRIVDRPFAAVRPSIAMPCGHDADLVHLWRLVEDAETSGPVARAMERTPPRRVSVAAPAK